MNLWGKRVGQLSVAAVALFFFSCKDEAGILGFPNPTSKFKASYVEIPIESSVMLLDSVRSSNYLPYFTTEMNRFLIGKYSDEQLGDVNAAACTQYFTTSAVKLANPAYFDSVSIQLRFDFYTYGSTDPLALQEIFIYELDKELKYDSIRYYFNNSQLSYLPTPLGSKQFTVNPAQFEGYQAVNKDTTITVRMPLDYTFGQKIFASAMAYRDATSAADSAFVRYSEFVKQFKGIAIVPGMGDKVNGFNPSATASKITLHYHTDTTDSLELNLSFKATAGFNNITSDRSATELAGLNSYFQDYVGTDKRFVQSGVGVHTKLDFSKYFEFLETSNISKVIINSAELVIGSVEDGGALTPPQNLVLRVLKDNNRPYKFSTLNDQSIKDLQLYRGMINPDYSGSAQKVAVDSDSTLTVMNDLSDYLRLKYSEEDKTYSGFLSLFMQQLFDEDADKTRFKYFVLYPADVSPGKSVNRVIFPKDKITLKIYYTEPITNQ